MTFEASFNTADRGMADVGITGDIRPFSVRLSADIKHLSVRPCLLSVH